jgi:hypothetical protein
MLEIIATKLRKSGQKVFLHNEDERLANAVIAVMRRTEISQNTIHDWLNELTTASAWNQKSFDHWQEEFVQKHPWWPAYNDSPASIHVFKNIQNFIRSLYFQLKLGKRPDPLKQFLPSLEKTIKRLDTGFLELE